MTVNATTEVLLNTPLLKVTGDIIDNCEGNQSTLKALRDSYNDHAHDVKDVQSVVVLSPVTPSRRKFNVRYFKLVAC